MSDHREAGRLAWTDLHGAGRGGPLADLHLQGKLHRHAARDHRHPELYLPGRGRAYRCRLLAHLDLDPCGVAQEARSLESHRPADRRQARLRAVDARDRLVLEVLAQDDDAPSLHLEGDRAYPGLALLPHGHGEHQLARPHLFDRRRLAVDEYLQGVRGLDLGPAQGNAPAPRDLQRLHLHRLPGLLRGAEGEHEPSGDGEAEEDRGDGQPFQSAPDATRPRLRASRCEGGYLHRSPARPRPPPLVSARRPR